MSFESFHLFKIGLNLTPSILFNLSEYMKNENIEITIDLSIGNKKFTAYTMDLSKEYIEINSDYRS